MNCNVPDSKFKEAQKAGKCWKCGKKEFLTFHCESHFTLPPSCKGNKPLSMNHNLVLGCANCIKANPTREKNPNWRS